MVKFLKRLSVFLVIPVLILCCSVPAFAAGPLVDEPAPTQYIPRVGFRVYLRDVYQEFDDSATFYAETSFRGLDRTDPYNKDTSADWPNYYQTFSMRPNFLGYGNYPTKNIWIQGHDRIVTKTVNGVEQFRISEIFEVNRQYTNEMGQTNFVKDSVNYLLVFDNFGGSYSRDFLSQFFYVDGNFRYQVRGTFYTIKNNKLITYPFIFSPFTSNGQQAILTQNYLNNIQNQTGVSDGDPFFISDLTVTFLDKETFLRVSRLADVNNDQPSFFDTNYPIYGTGITLEDFLTDNGLLTGPSQSFLAGEDITDFVAGSAKGVFDAKLFGDWSLSTVLTTIFIVGVVFWLLKTFAGG